MKKILIYGYGNPGRQDDGLGAALVEMLEQWAHENKIENVDFDTNYQLNIEDALTISEYDTVVFADATIEEDVKDFLFDELKPSRAIIEFTMHASSPGYILDLCHKMYNKNPEAWLMHIKGYEWELKEGVTEKANANLIKSVAQLKKWISERK
ncbi:MAG: hydrogenase maturation protease [Bacteroidota bacterium]